MQRDFTVDLFRIIATVFVIILHVLGQGGILRSLSPGDANYWAAWLMEIIAYCSVNCFALISGYVMVERDVKVKNILSLWFQLLFYSLILTFLRFVFFPEARNLKDLVFAFLPVLSKQWWYMSSYFALVLFIPIINAGINRISQQTFKRILAVILIVVCFVCRFTMTDAFVLSDGYSAIWLIIMYLFGAYISKYELKRKTTASKSLLMFLLMVIITLLSKVIILFITENIFGQVKYENAFISYVSVTIVLASVFLFLFCLNLKLGSLSKRIISFFAPMTLGVYVIHVHPFVFTHMIRDAFAVLAHKPIIAMVAGVLAAALSIFLLCSVIDLVRIWIFRLVGIDKLCKRVGSKITEPHMSVKN